MRRYLLGYELGHIHPSHTMLPTFLRERGTERFAIHKVAYLWSGVNARLDRRRLLMLEWILELPIAATEKPFFADVCAVGRLTLTPHQQAQAGLSTTAGGLSVMSAADRCFTATVGSVCEALPVVLTSLKDPLGDSGLGKLPTAPLVQEMKDAVGGRVPTIFLLFYLYPYRRGPYET